MVSRHTKSLYGLQATLLVLIVLFTSIEIGFAAPQVEFSDNRITVRAKNYSMVRLLEQVAKKTNVVIFVSKDFDPGSVTIQLDKVPLEQAFKKLLKQHNFVTIYNKKNDDFIISALKIYPKGKSAGQMDILITKSISSDETHMENAGSTPIVPGLTLPGEYVKYAATKNKSMIPVAYGFEKTEKKVSKEINELRQKISHIENNVEKDLLTLELMEKLVTFEDMQRGHVDVLESLYRAALFKQNSQQTSD